MIEYKGNHRKQLAGLFPEYTWNYIADSIMEGNMGRVFVNNEETPQVAVLTIFDGKIQILGGDAKHAAAGEYLSGLPKFSMLFPGAPGWKNLLEEVHPGKIIPLKRYAFSSERLDRRHLSGLKSRLSEQYRIEKIDLPRAQQIMAEKNDLTEDQLFGFESPEDFIAKGIGYCALDGEKLVCIASSGAVCSKGIEIQVNTAKQYQGRGLASAVSATLILECLEQGIDPNWDAATEISAGLAKKLGYTPQGEYDYYFYTGSKFLVSLRNFLRRIRGKEG